jgi:hypothetical protein
VKKQRRFVVMEFGREEVEEGKKDLRVSLMYSAKWTVGL